MIEEYLKYGIEIFQMQTGIVSHIIEDKKYIVKDVVTNLEVIIKGDIFELEGTYCREVFKTHKTLGFPQVGNIPELQHHPVYENLKLEAYISAPIYVRDKIYGTLNFTSLIPREYGFSEHEHDLISMMAQAIGNFILLQQKEENLKYLNFRMKELVGHVANDLRNPIGAIQSLSELSLKPGRAVEKVLSFVQNINEESGRALELINNILNEAALGTGKIEMDKSNFSIKPVLEKVFKSFKQLQEQRHLSIELKLPDGLKVFGDEKRIRQVFDNLFNNTLKYSQENSVITLNFINNDKSIDIQIINKKATEQAELDKSRYQSIGYGMDIVKEILKQHNTELFIAEDSEFYKVSFTLKKDENSST